MSTLVSRVIDTRIDLPENVRAEVTQLLNAALADLTDLKSQTKYAHWNVKGPNFYSLHILFDKLAESFDEQIDDVAERIAALGATAHGTVRQAARKSSIPEFPEDLRTDIEFAAVLAEHFAVAGAAIRNSIDRASQLGDQGTADLFTGISRELDKSTWFLEANARK